MTSPGKQTSSLTSHSTLPGKFLRRSAMRYIRQHPWQTWLSFIGIMLGVMMLVSINIAVNSANRSFSDAVETVNGPITHQIVSNNELVPEETYTHLRTELGIRRSAPVLNGQVTLQGQALTLVGYDVISEASLQRQSIASSNDDLNMVFTAAFMPDNGILITQETADSLNLIVGDSVEVFSADLNSLNNSTSVYFAGILSSGMSPLNEELSEGLIITGIGLAQQLLDKRGSLDSIDLIINSSQANEIKQWLPTGLNLIDTQESNSSLQQMTKAFQVNLQAMSMLSLLVAGLLIYNTATLSVLRREKTLGIFRSLGVNRKQIFFLILGESALLGFVASALGVVFGYSLANIMINLVSQSALSVGEVQSTVKIWPLLIAFLIGFGITLLSTALPAWRATQCTPVTLQLRSVLDNHWRTKLPRLAWAGLLMMLSGFLLLQIDRASLIAGFVALTFIVFGFCFLVPSFMNWSLNLVLSAFNKALSISGKMALRNIQSGISRTGLAVAALTIAISVTVGVGIMVESFRATVELWLDQTLSGDIIIAGDNIPPQLREDVSQIEGVASVNNIIFSTAETEFGELQLTISELPAQQSYYLKDATDEQINRFNNAEGILVSEPLAYLNQIEISDSITVFTDKGPQDFPVLGIFYDYTPGTGYLGLSPALYSQWWDTQVVTRMTVTADNFSDQGASLLPVIRELLSEQSESFFAIPNSDIRELTMTVFTRTFVITDVMRMLALLVAFIGILSALMALLLERLREFAILRASGMTPRQIIVLVLGQTAMIGVFAGLLSLPLGLMMADVLIEVINKRSFGWSMQHSLPQSVLLEAMVLAVLAALFAGLYPAYKSSRISPAASLREE